MLTRKEMYYDYNKRDYLLPEGCKDLIDVLKLKSQMPERNESVPTCPVPLPPVAGEILIPAQITVRQLAELLQQKPFRIIADLMELNVFATVSQMIDFETSSKVARKYGFVAKNELKQQ